MLRAENVSFFFQNFYLGAYFVACRTLPPGTVASLAPLVARLYLQVKIYSRYNSAGYP